MDSDLPITLVHYNDPKSIQEHINGLKFDTSDSRLDLWRWANGTIDISMSRGPPLHDHAHQGWPTLEATKQNLKDFLFPSSEPNMPAHLEAKGAEALDVLKCLDIRSLTQYQWQNGSQTTYSTGIKVLKSHFGSRLSQKGTRGSSVDVGASGIDSLGAPSRSDKAPSTPHQAENGRERDSKLESDRPRHGKRKAEQSLEHLHSNTDENGSPHKFKSQKIRNDSDAGRSQTGSASSNVESHRISKLNRLPERRDSAVSMTLATAGAQDEAQTPNRWPGLDAYFNEDPEPTLEELFQGPYLWNPPERRYVNDTEIPYNDELQEHMVDLSGYSDEAFVAWLELHQQTISKNADRSDIESNIRCFLGMNMLQLDSYHSAIGPIESLPAPSDVSQSDFSEEGDTNEDARETDEQHDATVDVRQEVDNGTAANTADETAFEIETGNMVPQNSQERSVAVNHAELAPNGSRPRLEAGSKSDSRSTNGSDEDDLHNSSLSSEAPQQKAEHMVASPLSTPVSADHRRLHDRSGTVASSRSTAKPSNFSWITTPGAQPGYYQPPPDSPTPSRLGRPRKAVPTPDDMARAVQTRKAFQSGNVNGSGSFNREQKQEFLKKHFPQGHIIGSSGVDLCNQKIWEWYLTQVARGLRPAITAASSATNNFGVAQATRRPAATNIVQGAEHSPQSGIIDLTGDDEPETPPPERQAVRQAMPTTPNNPMPGMTTDRRLGNPSVGKAPMQALPTTPNHRMPKLATGERSGTPSHRVTGSRPSFTIPGPPKTHQKATSAVNWRRGMDIGSAQISRAPSDGTQRPSLPQNPPTPRNAIIFNNGSGFNQNTPRYVDPRSRQNAQAVLRAQYGDNPFSNLQPSWHQSHLSPRQNLSQHPVTQRQPDFSQQRFEFQTRVQPGQYQEQRVQRHTTLRYNQSMSQQQTRTSAVQMPQRVLPEVSYGDQYGLDESDAWLDDGNW